MSLISAGLLIYRLQPHLQFLLVHPGGPFFKNKDEGSWTIPKGLVLQDEEKLHTAIRECQEETGLMPAPPYHTLPVVRLKSGKYIHAWASASDFDIENFRSNTFELEWPPKSGKIISLPEVDRVEWFDEGIALQKINPAQTTLIHAFKEQVEADKLRF